VAEASVKRAVGNDGPRRAVNVAVAVLGEWVITGVWNGQRFDAEVEDDSEDDDEMLEVGWKQTSCSSAAVVTRMFSKSVDYELTQASFRKVTHNSVATPHFTATLPLYQYS
jgi:hypothetical protein